MTRPRPTACTSRPASWNAQAGKTQTAMQLYRKSLAANRGHIAARQQLIKIYESRKEWNRAAGNTVVLLEYEPKNADLHLFLSQMYMNMNKFDAALKRGL